MKFYYITFRSITFAQRGERVLRDADVYCTLLRTPRWMEQQGCGYCLRLWTADVDNAVARLRRSGVPMRRVYLQLSDGTLEELQL